MKIGHTVWNMTCHECTSEIQCYLQDSPCLQMKETGCQSEETRKQWHDAGAKHIVKSKCTKDTMIGALLQVQMSTEMPIR